MNADAHVIALVQSSCMCSSVAVAVRSVRARSSPRATHPTLPIVVQAADCAIATFPPRPRPDLARDRDLVRALLEFRARAGNEIKH